MAVLDAHITPYGQGGHETPDLWAATLDGYDPDTFLLLGEYEALPSLNNQYSRVQAAAHVRPVSADVALHYVDDFYNRIHVKPTLIALGNLLSAEVRYFWVWNAYLATAANLESVVEEGTGGIDIAEPEPAPTAFGANEEREYEVTITTDGPAVIDATITFVFTGLGDYPIAITGQRVTFFPFVPRWGFTEKLAWWTGILQTRKGEQRIAYLDAPRQSFSLRYTFDSTLFAMAKNMAKAWSHRMWGLPLWHEQAKATASSGAAQIAVDTTAADYRAGGLIALWKSEYEWAILEIDTVEADRVHLSLPLEQDWTDAFIMPVRLARTPEGIELVRHTGRWAEMSADFKVTESAYLGESDFSEYDGYEVADDPNYMIADLSERMSVPQQAFDNGQGPVAYETDIDYTHFAQTIGRVAKGREETWRLRRWLHSKKGKQKAFWLPTWNYDLVVVEPVTEFQTYLVCEDTGLALYGDFPAPIMIEFVDGTRMYRKITDAESMEDNRERVYIDEAVGVVDPADIDRICYLHLMRLNADQVEIKHQAVNIAKMSTSVMEVPE